MNSYLNCFYILANKLYETQDSAGRLFQQVTVKVVDTM